MSNAALAISFYLFAMTLLTFALYGLDKRAARMGNRRIPEATLLVFGFLGGTLGGLMGQRIFRHKTKKGSFQFRFWALTLVQIGLGWAAAIRYS